jgi:hypothetical protein
MSKLSDKVKRAVETALLGKPTTDELPVLPPPPVKKEES